MKYLLQKVLFLVLVSETVFSQDTVVVRNTESNYVLVSFQSSNPELIIKYEFQSNPQIKDGLFIRKEFYSSDTIISRCNYSNNTLDGSCVTIKNLDTIQKVNFKNGVRNGCVLDFIQFIDEDFKKDTIYVKGRYKNGVRKGLWNYYLNDELIAQGKYSKDTIYIRSTIKNTCLVKNSGDTLGCFVNNTKTESYLYKNYGRKLGYMDWFILRRGTWFFYSTQGDKIIQKKYNHSGKLRKSEEYSGSLPIWVDYIR